MSAPKTQRFYLRIMGHTFFIGTETDKAHQPYLLVPEAAVKGCKHDDAIISSYIWVCADCGCWKTWLIGNSWSRWQRPRILRVGRSK